MAVHRWGPDRQLLAILAARKTGGTPPGHHGLGQAHLLPDTTDRFARPNEAVVEPASGMKKLLRTMVAKKVGLKDAFRALYCLTKYGLRRN
jgi:hypothetical protein